MTNIERNSNDPPLPPPALLDSASLFVDFDGTLIELAERPDAVRVGEALLTLVEGLRERFDGRFVIVSGRSIAQIETLLGPVARTIALTGSHGCEHRWKGGSAQPAPLPELGMVASRMRVFADRHPGTMVEEKSFGVALHYRLVPLVEAKARLLGEELAAEFGLCFQQGKMVVELRPGGEDKGTAIRRWMEHAPMRGTRPVFLGDDITDEAGFAAVRDLGGAGILVGAPRPTAATYRLASPAAARAWLGEALR